MINLKNIKNDIQNIADAIASVLNVDVTIVDDNLVRIAGTGKYKANIGELVNVKSAFGSALKIKEGFIIEDPRENSICQICCAKNNCIEFAEVCTPIILEGKTYGVIGLIAFDEKQKGSIVNNKENLLSFLDKMAELIGSKIKAEIKTLKLKVEAIKNEALLNNIDKAIVSCDVSGLIDAYNNKFTQMFELQSSVRDVDINDILPFLKVKDMIDLKTNTFVYEKGGMTIRGVYHVNVIIIEDEIGGYVLELKDNISAIKDINEMTAIDYEIKFSNIIGNSEVMNKVKRESQIASTSSSTILITGESGTGKELFARAIHQYSKREKQAFVAINCGAIPDNLLESELFGYEEGAFTGAKKGGKIGKFELANNGTIFLDEIGDMSLHLQVKLLRVLQEREIEKIGGRTNVPIDVRIIAATNKNLEELVKKAEFREDLYYRLNVIPINIPPLRERREDIKILIDSFIKNYSKKLNKNITGISDRALDKLINSPWPGNVRQLENVIEYCVNMNFNSKIEYDDLPLKIKIIEDKEFNSNDEKIVDLKKLEKNEIEKALKKYKDFKKDKEKICEVLGISRATLYRKIKEYNLE